MQLKDIITPALITTILMGMGGYIWAQQDNKVEEVKEAVEKKLDSETFKLLLEQQKEESKQQWTAIQNNQQILLKIIEKQQ